MSVEDVRSHAKFQSTPSARRATGLGMVQMRVPVISIHALRKEGDSKNGQNFPLILTHLTE